MSHPVQGIPRIDAVRPQPEVSRAAEERSDFFQTIQEAMRQVEHLQADGQKNVADLLEGKGETLHGAMIAVQKADLAFQLMVQVRNKIVEAYQEISRMPF